MTSIDKYLKDPDCTNWVKSCLALNITHEVLRPFVVKEITKLHQSIVKKLPSGGSCGGCRVNTGCPNGICDKIQSEIKNKHWCSGPSFTNTCTGRWKTEPWEIAKCFMPPFKGYKSSSASDADFSACINVIINCRHFQTFGTSDPNITKTTVYSKSRDFRNRVMHASQQKVTENDMTYNLDILIYILTKIETPETEDDTKEAIAKIQKTKQMKINIGDAIEMRKNATEASADIPKKDKDQVQRERLLVNFEAGCRKALCRLTEEHISKQKGHLSVADFLSKLDILAVIKNLCSKHEKMLFPENGTHEDIREWDLFVYCFILEELDLSEPLENAVSRFVHEVTKIRDKLLLDATGVTQDDLSELCEYLIDTDLKTEITEIFNKDSPDVDVICSNNNLVSWWRQEEEYENKQVSKKQLNKEKQAMKEFEEINRHLAEQKKTLQRVLERLEHVGENVTLQGANAAEIDIDAECELRTRGCDEETEEATQEHITSPENNDLERNEAFEHFRKQRNLREVKPVKGSIILNVKCSSITNVIDFWDSCIDGRAVEALSKVRDYYRRYFTCDTLEFDVILTKKGISRCVNKIVEGLAFRFDMLVDNVTYKVQEILKAKDIQPIPGLGKDSMVVDDGSDILVESDNDYKPGFVRIIYENDEDDADTQHGVQTESQISNEPPISSDEFTSLSFGIDIEKDEQDDSLQGIVLIMDHIQSSSLTISSTTSSEDRRSDDNATVDTSSGFSQSIPVVGIDADVHRDTTTDAQSPPDQSDDSMDDPAKLTFRQRLAKMEMSSRPPSESKRDSVSVKSSDSVRRATFNFEQAAASSAESLRKPKPTPRSTITGGSNSFKRSKQQMEEVSSVNDVMLRSPSNGSHEMNASSKVSPTPNMRDVSSDSVRKSKLFFEETAAKSAVPVQKPKPEPRSAKIVQSEPFQDTVQQTEESSLGIDTILSSLLNAPQETDDGAHETSNPRRTKVSPSFEASKQIAESIKDKIAERMSNPLRKKSSGYAVPNAMYSVQAPTTHDNAERRPAPTTREINKTSKDKTMVVAAIDFGTTYSAVAFSFKNDPERIICKTWDGQVKVPTAILLNPNKDVESFGETAKVTFAEKFDDQKTYKDWFYFEHFKMKLYQMYLDRSVMLTDHSGKEMTAIDVFAKALSYMRKELLDLLNDERRGVVIRPDSDIHWVLTVPAIWPDMSKTFMRQAAEMANIPSDYLTLALEPEAASLYCRRKLGVNLRGKKYLVLDLGGGTADIVAHEIQNDDSIKECHMACGGDFGGKMVDDEFFKLLVRLYGGDVINAFRQTKDHFDFNEAFETAKRTFDGGKDCLITLPTRLNEIYESMTGQSIELSIEQSLLKGQVSWEFGHMKINRDVMRSIFDIPLKRILQATAKAINTIGHNEAMSHATNKNAGVHHILMVGGFSNSSYIVEGLKQAYPESGFVIIPEEPSIAVIKGAVRFGQEPRAIESRMSKYTYGMGRMMKFKPGDREDYKVFANGIYWCDNCFNTHIELGEELSTDERRVVKAHDYYPPDAGVRQFILEVFASRESNPRYTTDDSCKCIGCMRLDMDSHGDVWSKIEVKLVYTGTELEIQAYDVQNKKLTIGKVDFFG